MPLQQSKNTRNAHRHRHGAGGATGTATCTATGHAGGKSNYKHETTSSSLGVSKTVTHSTIAPGTVESQHVSVLLDHSVPASALPAISEAITNAAGIQTKRGDTISIGQVAFAKTDRQPRRAASSMLGYAKYALLGDRRARLPVLHHALAAPRESEPIEEPVWLRELDAPMRLSELERETATTAAPRWSARRRRGNGERERERQRQRDARESAIRCAARSSSSPTATPTGSPSSCATGCRRTSSAMAGESLTQAALPGARPRRLSCSRAVPRTDRRARARPPC